MVKIFIFRVEFQSFATHLDHPINSRKWKTELEIEIFLINSVLRLFIQWKPRMKYFSFSWQMEN